MKTHKGGCRCFLCALDREEVLDAATRVAERYELTVEQMGEGGRAPSPRVALARRELAAELVRPTRRGRAAWSVNSVARLFNVDPKTVRYWLQGGQNAA